MRINLLNLQAHLQSSEFHFSAKQARACHPLTTFEAMVATLSPPRILPSGDSAITVEFSRNIDDAANQRVLALDRIIASEPDGGLPASVGGEDGIDLEDVAKTLKTTPDDIVARHAGGDYRVAMIGFSPGWSYLSGLEDSLQMPPRQNPRLSTPAGTISIGGVQTA